MRAIVLAVLAAWVVFAYAANAQVKQTELPPPPGVGGTGASEKASDDTNKGAQTPAKPSTKKGKLTDEQKAAEKAAEEARWSGTNKNLTETPPPAPPAPEQPSVVPPPPAQQSATTAPAAITRATSGKRVAAFWIIAPGK